MPLRLTRKKGVYTSSDYEQPLGRRGVLNQVLVSFGSAERTREVIDRVQRDGTCWCGGTVWQGHAAMRISVSSWATTEADVERSLAAILSVAS